MPRPPRALCCALAIVAVLLAPAAAEAADTAQRAQAQSRPNVVFIMTDDQTASSISVQPHVRRLQREGTTFTQAIATYPLCCPSRSTYLSGQYSHNHGVIHNAGPHGGYTRFDHSNALPLWMQAAGYRTMHVGRYLNGYGVQNPDKTEMPPGWNDWISAVGDSVFNFASWQMNENGNVLWRPTADHPGEHQTDFFGRRAAELVDSAAPSSQPFFLSLTLPAPHLGFPIEPDDPPIGPLLGTPVPAARHRDYFKDKPLPRPPNFDEADVSDKPQIVSDRPRLTPEVIAAIQENYQQELEALLSVDDAVGAVLSALERSGELSNTLVIYTSDNGFFHGEHRVPAEKILPYEPGIRIPLVARGPGMPANRSLDQLVGNIDWTPTILAAAGAKPGRLQDGRSLFELAADNQLEWGRELVLENGFGANGVPMYRAVRNQRFLWVEHGVTGEYELYDLRKDPYELRNLAYRDSYAVLRERLSKRLRKLKNCRGAKACGATRPSLRLAVRAAPKPTPKRVAPRRRRARASACSATDLRLTVTGKDRALVEQVSYLHGATRLGSTKRAPFAALVRGRRLPGASTVVLRALVTTVDGRRATYDRQIQTCPR